MIRPAPLRSGDGRAPASRGERPRRRFAFGSGRRRRRSAFASARRLLLAALTFGLLAGCAAPLTNVDVSDPVITARIKGRLRERTDLNIAFVDVNTHQREVTLSGVVGSVEEKEEIVRLVRRTPGVRRVIANILIQQ